MLPDYGVPVGATEYSAPETFCGLSGNREVATASDVYALGCLLYELFNQELFVYASTRRPNFNTVLAAMSLDLLHKDQKDRVTVWCKNVQKLARAFSPVRIDGPGSSVPPSIAQLLNILLESLTEFDFSKRLMDLSRVRRYVGSAITILNNEANYQRRIAERERRRQKRLEKLRRKQQRLDVHLSKRSTSIC